jgi:hypothetical protein
MDRQFIASPQRGEHGAGDDAAIARAHLGLLPNVAKQHLVPEASELRHSLVDPPTLSSRSGGRAFRAPSPSFVWFVAHWAPPGGGFLIRRFY